MSDIYALVENDVVTNLIVWDGNDEIWQPPEGSQAILTSAGESVLIGYTYDGAKFSAPATA
ncbi:hypothetical protein [Burkholderia ubonensis]|uniref:hypothetical protein n=1 Tax=Burkholderia ubonensis TaxID=101571 RepID=UPI0007C6B881|nr:hypothetical protein [Burkholderia ubonensis]